MSLPAHFREARRLLSQASLASRPQDPVTFESAVKVVAFLKSDGTLAFADLNNRLPVNTHATNTLATPGSILTGNVGDIIRFRISAAGGGASPFLFSAYPTTEQLWEILMLQAMLQADGNPAARTLSLVANFGTGSVADSWGSSTVAITANENGVITATPNGVFLNDNGTVTRDSLSSPVPAYATAIDGAMKFTAGLAGTGLAGDTFTMDCIARRVA